MMPIRSLITLSTMVVVIASVSFEALARTSASNDASKLVSADTLSAASTTDAIKQKDEQLLQTSETDTAQVSEERNPPTEAVSRPLKRTLDEFLNFGFSAGETSHFSSHHPGANLEAAENYAKEWTAAQKSQMVGRVKHWLRQHTTVEKVHDELKIYRPNPELSPNFPLYHKYVDAVYRQLKADIKQLFQANLGPYDIHMQLQSKYGSLVTSTLRYRSLFYKAWKLQNSDTLSLMITWLNDNKEPQEAAVLLGLEGLSSEALFHDPRRYLLMYYERKYEKKLQASSSALRPSKAAKKD